MRTFQIKFNHWFPIHKDFFNAQKMFTGMGKEQSGNKPKAALSSSPRVKIPLIINLDSPESGTNESTKPKHVYASSPDRDFGHTAGTCGAHDLCGLGLIDSNVSEDYSISPEICMPPNTSHTPAYKCISHTPSYKTQNGMTGNSFTVGSRGIGENGPMGSYAPFAGVFSGPLSLSPEIVMQNKGIELHSHFPDHATATVSPVGLDETTFIPGKLGQEHIYESDDISFVPDSDDREGFTDSDDSRMRYGLYGK